MVNENVRNMQARARPALPTTMEDLVAMRTSPLNRTINDRVEDYFQTLMTKSDRFRLLLDGCVDEDTVEGRIVYDDAEAARMIREMAKSAQDPFIEAKNVATLVKALHVCMRRYKLDRKRRANTLGDEIVPGGEEEETQ